MTTARVQYTVPTSNYNKPNLRMIAVTTTKAMSHRPKTLSEQLTHEQEDNAALCAKIVFYRRIIKQIGEVLGHNGETESVLDAAKRVVRARNKAGDPGLPQGTAAPSSHKFDQDMSMPDGFCKCGLKGSHHVHVLS